MYASAIHSGIRFYTGNYSISRPSIAILSFIAFLFIGIISHCNLCADALLLHLLHFQNVK